MSHPPVLIESWLPIEAIGAESKRERGASSALPPLYFLHVWWARRPLMTSRAAILAGVLPQWSPDLKWTPLSRHRFDENEVELSSSSFFRVSSNLVHDGTVAQARNAEASASRERASRPSK